MRVLVTWGSKCGGTEGIARIIGTALDQRGLDVEMLPAEQAHQARPFDAVIVGGALYANRWHSAARRFVMKRQEQLRRVPVWFFSSGPLDDSAEREPIPPCGQVKNLMARVGARGHITFGGRLSPDARGFPASAMAKTHSGDWRQPHLIRAWAREIATELPTARPGVAVVPPGGSLLRLVGHGFAGWATSILVLAAALMVTSPRFAILAHALVAPIAFVAVARRYFLSAGARDPLPTAAAFVAIGAALDVLIIAGIAQRGAGSFTSLAAWELPYLLVFFATWITGFITSTMPWPKLAAAGPESK